MDKVHDEIRKETFGGSEKAYLEFHVLTALNSKNSLKKIFSIMFITDVHKKYRVNPSILILIILILLKETSAKIRAAVLKLAEAAIGAS